ncbi:hypothetical protein NK718_02915 [Alsobacter sp. SYSU M60028]|uniref:Integral membrane protein n=1 Tax=Alsobacter ponti TaxID=2962936 RepID=A0ABT1L7K0_9HYPH|nr:hypothetical protein [Alsobacter ponti]MCP8937454.1 hypothetical protein [Alsobacter ponti]
MRTQLSALPLETVLVIDAATCAAMGVVLVGFAPSLASLLGIPGVVLTAAGAILFPCAFLMLAAARLPSLTSPLGWLVVLGNLGWAAASVGLLLAVPVTPVGEAVVLLQAAAVLILAQLEWKSLRRLPRPNPAHG